MPHESPDIALQTTSDASEILDEIIRERGHEEMLEKIRLQRSERSSATDYATQRLGKCYPAAAFF